MKMASFFICANCSLAHHVAGFLGEDHVERHHVGLAQQRPPGPTFSTPASANFSSGT